MMVGALGEWSGVGVRLDDVGSDLHACSYRGLSVFDN